MRFKCSSSAMLLKLARRLWGGRSAPIAAKGAASNPIISIVVCHPSSAICHLSSVIRRLLSALCHPWRAEASAKGAVVSVSPTSFLTEPE